MILSIRFPLKNLSYKYHDMLKSKDNLHECHLKINPLALEGCIYMDQSNELDYLIKYTYTNLSVSHTILDEI